MRVSESYHVRWRSEEREELIARKELAKTLREAQGRLRRIGAVDSPQNRVMYWDEPLLFALVGQMRAYLREHSEIEFASEILDRFERAESAAPRRTARRRLPSRATSALSIFAARRCTSLAR